MSNNLYKSSYVNHEQEVRVINSNELVAKKLDSIANSVILSASSADASDIHDVSAVDVASLLKEEPSDGFVSVESSRKSFSNINTLRSTNINASDIVSKAQKEAETIISNAQKEAEEIKKSAYKEGYNLGYDEGVAAAKNTLTEKEIALNKEKETLAEEYRTKIDEIEPMLVDALSDIYEYVFNIDFSERKEIIYHLAKSTLCNMETGKNYILRLSTEDFSFFSMQKRELVKGSGVPVENIELVEDKTLSHGNAFIETEGGIFDCSVSTHFENLKKTLQILGFTKD